MNNTTQTTKDTSQIRASLLMELMQSASNAYFKMLPYKGASSIIEGRCAQLKLDGKILQDMYLTEMSSANMKDTEQSEPISPPATCIGGDLYCECWDCNPTGDEKIDHPERSKPLNERDCPFPKEEGYEETERIRITPKGEAMMKEDEHSELNATIECGCCGHKHKVISCCHEMPKDKS